MALKPKNISNRYLILVDKILKIENEEYCNGLKDDLISMFVEIRQMGMELVKLQNGGKLPNANSVGWMQQFWKKKIWQVIRRRESIKRVLAVKQLKEKEIEKGRKLRVEN